MNLRFYLIIAFLLVAITGCSQQILGGKKKSVVNSFPKLKQIQASLNTNKIWQVKTTNVMGNNKIHPYLDNKTIFVAGGTTVSAWQASSGKQLWRTAIGESITAGVNGTLLSNPQNETEGKPVTAAQVFVGTDSGNAISLDAKTGKVQWIERLSSEVLSVSASDNDRVAFRTVDGKLHGLSSKSGELIWQRAQKTPALTQLGAGVPLIVSTMVVAGFDNGKVAAYELQTGKPLWQIALALPSGNKNLEQIVDVDGKLKQLGNGLFATSLNGSTIAINLEEGKQGWSKAFSSATGIEGNPGGLFSSDDEGTIWGFDPQTGNPAWNINDLAGRQPSVPILLNNTTLVVTDIEGNIHFMNVVDGKFIARHKGDPKGYIVEPTVSGKSVYLMGKSGLLSKYSL